MPPEEFKDEYIGEGDGFPEEEGLFTCWSELDGGCYIIHPFLADASVCFVVNKSQIFEVVEKNIFKHWSAYTLDNNVLLVIENEAEDFELTDEETKYLVDLETL